ncbi:ornithine carbamoyltransferase [SAR202 cluster bacterium AC-409-J13_OGT_754m]|nr:ornithine carbamoyltransferase [SAR202 cluster bacterium AC-409-J13_OGT_754m]
MKSKDFLRITDLEPAEIKTLVKRAIELKSSLRPKPLLGRNIALLFEKPSLRTKLSFDIGVHQLGGHPVYMGPTEVGIGDRELVSDIAKVVSRYVDCIVARVNSHSTIEEMGINASIPVINALSDFEHPCQTLADLQTIMEHKGRLEKLKIAYIGDSNNVARSLALGTALVGSSFAIASPSEYTLDPTTLRTASRIAASNNCQMSTFTDPLEAIAGADVVYTDVWTSMGQEIETMARLKQFQGYTVDSQLMSKANKDAIFMHDMPAHYGEEVVEGMLDEPFSVAFHQAENRLHSQKALLEHIFERF